MGAGNEYNAINLTIGDDNLLKFVKIIKIIWIIQIMIILFQHYFWKIIN